MNINGNRYISMNKYINYAKQRSELEERRTNIMNELNEQTMNTDETTSEYEAESIRLKQQLLETIINHILTIEQVMGSVNIIEAISGSSNSGDEDI